MKHTTNRAQRILTVFFILLLSFESASLAYATSLTTIAVDSLGAIASAEISCHKNQIAGGIADIFGSDSSDAGEEEDTGLDGGGENVPIYVAKDSKVAKGTENAAKTQANDTTCTKAVEKAAAQVILKQLTVATVDWINHGFKGGTSFFPKDTQSFLKAIGDQATQKFIGNIGFDKKNYPFGRAVAQSLVKQLGNSFEQEAKYSLDRVLAEQYPNTTPPTVADFEKSFEDGGWSAFNAQFTIGNNPIAFKMGAESALAGRTMTTAYNPAQDIRDQLMRSGGFLDTKVCVAPSTYDEETSDKIAADAHAKIKALPDDASSEAQYKELKRIEIENTCTKYGTQTPGSVVSASLNKALSSPFDQLTNSDDLNADLTAIFDALANQLMQKGLSALSTTDPSAEAPITYSNNGSYVNPSIDVDNGDGVNTNGSWLAQGGGFNVFKDIPKIIPNEDYTPTGPKDSQPEGYQQVLEKQIQSASRLIPAIYEFDFCVPGPHPNWRSEAQNAMQKFTADTRQIPSNADSAISQGSLILNKVLDPINFLNLKNVTADKRNEKFFALVVGYNLSYQSPLPTDDNFDPNAPDITSTPTAVSVARNSKVNGHNNVVRIFSTLFNRYADLLDKRFSPDTNPDIASSAPLEYSLDRSEFGKIATYQKAIKDNETLINSSRSTVVQLQNLKKRIDALPTFDGYIDHSKNNLINPGTVAVQNNNVISAQLNGVGVLGTGGTTGGGVTPPTPTNTNAVVPHDKWYWYKQDFLAVQNVKSLSQLSAYQLELKRISSTFDLIAPKIHSTSDLTKQEDALTAINNELSDFKGKGGYIEMCVKDTADSRYTAPTTRMFFPQVVINKIPNLPARGSFPAYNGQQEMIDFEDGFNNVDISMMPDVHYAQGQKPDQISIFESRFGKQTPDNTIQSDDVVTIDDQPIKDAMAGLESIINIY